MNQESDMALASYRSAQATLESTDLLQDPDWIRDLRAAALGSFLSAGFPTARRGNETWKYTNVEPISSVIFHCPEQGLKPETKDLDSFVIHETNWTRLVFLNGAFSSCLSTPSLVNDGISVSSLANSLKSHSNILQKYLGQLADYSGEPFTALNTAFLHDGALVHLAKDTRVDAPIHLLFLTNSRKSDVVTHPRVLIIAEEGSQATIVESYGSFHNERYFCNTVTEVFVDSNAEVNHYRLQRHTNLAYQVGTTQVQLQQDSRFSSVALDLGGSLVRNNLTVLTDGEGSSCKLNGAYITNGKQHVDNQVIIDHAKAHTSSRELYKGILSGSSKAVFHGSIIVRPGAQKVDSRQEDRNLILSEDAEADVKPAFWINADDVKCGHGTASGRLDDDEVFYLKSRGLDENSAKRLLMRGFIKEVIDGIQCETLKLHVNDLVDSKLEDL
ncbi:Fe-S cluster assembly protein SufD [SAR202 cluster bacterium AD-804-J14_MRT_500m]|nr:Fe-S cluster assembly protein SufD [SAR202 cluster bacterium AD-804-J14_MRT_500m]